MLPSIYWQQKTYKTLLLCLKIPPTTKIPVFSVETQEITIKTGKLTLPKPQQAEEKISNDSSEENIAVFPSSLHPSYPCLTSSLELHEDSCLCEITGLACVLCRWSQDAQCSKVSTQGSTQTLPQGTDCTFGQHKAYTKA